ncbi:hypothetical protein QBC35DRAFT_539727 [Podospora australis]|uniref:Uncharacterized protein n=1 Tax=Podospora australis TaxID=1536484 RepID=A0AAN7AG55_9PEZI|nr:hypothetical protein QBC35DRAFT_539727 [Podospora australis]
MSPAKSTLAAALLALTLPANASPPRYPGFPHHHEDCCPCPGSPSFPRRATVTVTVPAPAETVTVTAPAIPYLRLPPPAETVTVTLSPPPPEIHTVTIQPLGGQRPNFPHWGSPHPPAAETVTITPSASSRPTYYFTALLSTLTLTYSPPSISPHAPSQVPPDAPIIVTITASLDHPTVTPITSVSSEEQHSTVTVTVPPAREPESSSNPPPPAWNKPYSYRVSTTSLSCSVIIFKLNDHLHIVNIIKLNFRLGINILLDLHNHSHQQLDFLITFLVFLINPFNLHKFNNHNPQPT